MSANPTQRLLAAARLFVDIALLKRGPEELPSDRSLLVTTVVAYAVVNLIFTALLPPQAAHPLVLLFIDAGLMLVWVRLLLQLARKPERYTQTATAVFGFQLVLAPLFSLGMAAFLRMRENPTWEVPASLVIMVLGIWALVVNARILRAATEWPTFACVGLVLAQALLARGILLAVFPEVAAAVPTTDPAG